MKELSILFEDDEIMVVDKPCGRAVQGGEGVAHSIDDDLSAQVGYRVHLVHRLDKDTAGLLVVAKNAKAASKWTSVLASHGVTKEYTAICIGVPHVSGRQCMSGTLRSSVQAHGRTQDAVTNYRVERTADVSVPAQQEEQIVTLSLVHITLGTGRMHQIRIQMAQAGAPLVGDDKHGDFKLNKKLSRLGMKKLCLAATSLTVPLSSGSRVFRAELPPHMAQIEKDFFSETPRDR